VLGALRIGNDSRLYRDVRAVCFDILELVKGCRGASKEPDVPADGPGDRHFCTAEGFFPMVHKASISIQIGVGMKTRRPAKERLKSRTVLRERAKFEGATARCNEVI
jgi:hypothetical protein